MTASGPAVSVIELLEQDISMKHSIWANLLLGLWLMLSRFALAFVNRRVLTVLWEDLLLGFGITTFSLSRILSRRKGEIVFALAGYGARISYAD
jgi:hypothetical protein